MKTKTPKTNSKPEEKKPETLFPNEPEKPEESASGYRPGSKISIPLKEDGTLDLDSMRDKTTERLRAAIAGTPAFMPPASGQTVSPPIPPEMIGAFYMGVGAVESIVAQWFGKVPKHIADRVFTYTPTELTLLTPPTTRVFAKYASGWFLKYQDEIVLTGLLLSVTLSKVNACTMLMKQDRPIVVEMPQKPEDEPKPPIQ
jgi:hypothetical protein